MSYLTSLKRLLSLVLLEYCRKTFPSSEMTFSNHLKFSRRGTDLVKEKSGKDWMDEGAVEGESSVESDVSSLSESRGAVGKFREIPKKNIISVLHGDLISVAMSNWGSPTYLGSVDLLSFASWIERAFRWQLLKILRSMSIVQFNEEVSRVTPDRKSGRSS